MKPDISNVALVTIGAEIAVHQPDVAALLSGRASQTTHDEASASNHSKLKVVPEL